MKVWIAIVAVAALTLAGVSIWFGLGVSAEYGFYLFVASALVACVATGLSWMNTVFGARHKVWAFAFRILLLFTPLVAIVGQESARFANGPFCGEYPSDFGLAGAVCPPLWISILDYACVFILTLAALLYVIWPQKQTTVNAAARTGARQ